MSRSHKKKPGSGGATPIFPHGVPVNESSGEPEAGAEIPEHIASRIPLDAESARVTELHRQTMSRKANGDRVKWSQDPRIRYMECVRMHPFCRVYLEQEEPTKDDNIDERPTTVLKTLSDVKRYLRDTHWKGIAATYRWTLYDDAQPQWAQGLLHFEADTDFAARKAAGVPVDEEPEMPRRRDDQPPPQWGGYQPPGYGAPPG